MGTSIRIASLVALAVLHLMAGIAPAEADPPPRRTVPSRPRAEATRPAPQPGPSAQRPPVKSYDFAADAIDGTRIQPDGTTLFGLRRPRFSSLIDVRGDFLREVVRSADRLP